MDFNKKFLEDEVRLGFYIPSSIKQAWAAELEVLNVVDQICESLDIRYCADWGTLLGAVRHGGFIPWDDDIDIVMLREDYNRFLAMAPGMLPQGYAIHTYRNEEGYREFHAVVMNTEHNCFEAEHMRRFHGFPYNCGLDIFVLDRVYDDESREQERRERIKYILAVADGMLDGDLADNKLRNALNSLGSYGIVIDEETIDLTCSNNDESDVIKKNLWVKLYEEIERICAETSSQESSVLIQMIPWGIKSTDFPRYKVTEYSELIRLPFEYTTIPVPVSYDYMLRRKYGAYHRLVRNAGAHGYPFFKSQKEQIEALSNVKFPTYEWNITESEWAKRSNEDVRDDDGQSFKELINEGLSELEALQLRINERSGDRQSDIADAQQLAIDIGNLIEKVLDENHTGIGLINKYCEALYLVYQSDEAGLSESLTHAYLDMVEVIRKDILDRKIVIFCPARAEHWDALKGYVHKESEDENTDVYICPIPYYYKDYDGRLTEGVYEYDRFCDAVKEDNIQIRRYDELNVHALCPDKIYIQEPFDAYDNVISVHPAYYTDRLAQSTEKLVYVPWYDLVEFDHDSQREYQNMEYYATMPGVVRSDEVWFSDEWIKSVYVDKLVSWAGEETRGLWENKIHVNQKDDSSNAELKGTKTLMYYVGEGLPIQQSETCIDTIKRNIRVLHESCEQINLVWIINETLFDNIRKFRPSLYETFCVLIEEYKTEGWGELYIRKNGDGLQDRQFVKRCDAYYGDAGIYVPMFITEKKPVMIQNWEML